MKNDWSVKKLGEVAHFQKGKMMPNSSINSVGSTPYILIDDLRARNYSHYTQSNQGTACLPSDSLLVWDGANAGTVGGDLQGFVGSTITKISPSENLDPVFLRLFLSSKSDKFNKQVHGAAIPHLNKDFVYDLPIPIPPTDIQKKIVEKLGGIRKAEELIDIQIQKTEELFNSVISKIFILNKKNLKLLGDICDFLGGGTPSKKNANYYKGLIPWVTIKDMHENEIYDSIDHVTENAIKESAANLVSANTLLVATRVGLGKIAITRVSACFNQDIKALIPRVKIIPQYLLYSMIYISPQIISQGVGGTVRGVNLNMLRKLQIPLPSITEQQQIVEKLEVIQEHKKLLQKQKQLYKELFTSVLDKSMKGEMD